MTAKDDEVATLEPETSSSSQDITPAAIGLLVRDLARLGLRSGDVVFARAATKPIFPGRKGTAVALRDAFLEVIGPEGTLLVPTHSARQLRRNSPRKTLFHPTSATISGGFAAAILDHKAVLRSTHPLDSIGVIGRHAAEFAAGHDERSLAHSWMERLIELGGKQVLIGCVASSPGLGTIHYSQAKLGLSKRSLLTGYEGTFVRRDDGKEEWVTRLDSPGCSKGFYKMYGVYVRQGILRSGNVGRAYAIMAPAAETFALDMKALIADPRSVLCDRPTCVSCFTRTYNLRALPRLVISQAMERLLRHDR